MTDKSLCENLTVEEEEENIAESGKSMNDSDTDIDYPNDLFVDYKTELTDLPHVFDYIKKLQRIIKRQQKNIKKLKKKLRNKKPVARTSDLTTQTDTLVEESSKQECIEENISHKEDGWDNCANLEEEVKQIAENALCQAGMVYEPTSGMYYDYKSGFYYNAELRMYYDGNSGRYLVYNEKTKEYSYHSEASTNENTTGNKKARKRKHAKGSEDESSRDTSDTSSHEEEKVEEDELEEGEWEPGEEPTAKEKTEPENEISSPWPPCLRLMVLGTSAPGLKVGQLFLVTCDGGEVGREGTPTVLLPEQSVSKVHLKISFKDAVYQIVDVGSRNGTWLNEKRVSASLQESEPTPIAHGDSLRIGSTKLGVHVHAGQETCDQCEPGLQLQKEVIPAPLPATVSLRSLRKRFGLGNQGAIPPPSAEYNDRAESRRAKVGSSHPAEKTETACVTQSIPAANKGFKMLEKMGWKEGKGLGKNDIGIKEPVAMISNEGSTGLGAASLGAYNINNTAAARRKITTLKITKTRFNQPAPFQHDAHDDDTN